ncbi:MAG: hypothetical protein XXXJIFNMEKO3_00334 [Candidatus Erwinia impunctatus]|nr:hypothetical protein XXXJIFNMEKO_00334 [Culicoides impunctatus]
MHHKALVFIVMALITAILAFSGIAGTPASTAKVIFGLGIALLLISLLSGKRSDR